MAKKIEVVKKREVKEVKKIGEHLDPNDSKGENVISKSIHVKIEE